MKKLMIAAAIVCAAVVSQAATANWKVGAANVKDGTGTTTSYSGTAYVFDAATVLGSVTDKTAQQIIFEAFAKDTAKFNATAQTGYAGQVTVASGTINQNSASGQFSYGDRSSEGKDVTHDFFFILVDGDNMYLSKSVTAKAYSDDKYMSVSYGNQNPSGSVPKSSSLPTDGFKDVGQWATAPEPTSGLLLLLGVAGLALRRRRA